ncbi:hypothetical protein Cgig2_007634 [Carnegiea gigantea]|uniref:Uncharacterized protein n=1 Tax=Carnegiea gigantea TaxID=171969 RepID=A0A9Q1JI20_9CARY|nr:hypothetical protein Cgig2_007634 [Carnegiea gigantea]
MIVIVDGPMIGRFIEDSEAFNRYADERLDLIEQNRTHQAKSNEFMPLDCEDCDENRSEVVDREKFRVELRAAMAATAEAIGKTPVNIVVDEGSLMMKVYEGEVKQIEKEKEEKMKKIEMTIRKCGDDQEGGREINGEIVGLKKVKKKRSMKFLNCCACSGKYYADNS